MSVKCWLPMGRKRFKPGSGAELVAEMSETEKTVMGVLRNRVRGIPVNQVVAATKLSDTLIREALNTLQKKGYANCESAWVHYGYQPIKMDLWNLTLNEWCIEVMAYLPRFQETWDMACPELVPPELWRFFYSGTSASDLRLPKDAFFVASTLLSTKSVIAQHWALTHLPAEALKKCRQMRGYDTGEIALLIDNALKLRLCA